MHKTLRKLFLNSCSDNLKSKIENLKWLGLSVIAFVLVVAGAVAQAQQPASIHRIGILSISGSVFPARVEAFRRRLRELGYIEGQNIVFEYRYAEGKQDRYPELAAELVRLKVDVLVTAGTPAARAAKNATATIPIVFAGASDPLGTGIVSSLAQPGGNITGLSLMVPDLDGKRLELLKETVPQVARVAFLWQPGGRGNLRLTDMEAATKALGVKLLSLEVRSLDDFEGAFARAKKERAQALITTTGGRINTQQRQVLDFAAKNRLPAIYHYSEFVEAGGLMSYGPDNTDIWRRAADFVDKILKGAKPADLPVEQPKKFEFIINLKAAKQIGLTIPETVLFRADKVIK
jgi:putative tryptophan/tyrosine transport system substrate-binding protein